MTSEKQRTTMLRASLRKRGDDILEFRRGWSIEYQSRYFGFIFIALFMGMMFYGDFVDKSPLFTNAIGWVKRDWGYIDKALNPDKYIKPYYEAYVRIEEGFIADGEVPMGKPRTFEEYKKSYMRKRGGRIWSGFFIAITPYLFVFWLLLKPHHYPVRIDRRKGLIYTYWLGDLIAAPITLGQDTPSEYALLLSDFDEHYERGNQQKSLWLTLYAPKYKKVYEEENFYKVFDGWRFERRDCGVYPRLINKQNIILLKAINEYVNSRDGDSELDSILDDRYHTPWIRPKIFFITLFPIRYFQNTEKLNKKIEAFKQLIDKHPIF